MFIKNISSKEMEIKQVNDQTESFPLKDQLLW